MALRRLRPDECVTPALYNAVVDVIWELSEAAAAPQRWPITGAFPVEVRKHPGGVHVSLAYTDRDALVELTGTLASGGSATAKVLWFDGTWDDAATDEITVNDAVGTMEGDPGDKALVKFHRQSGRWLVWQLQC